MVHGWYVSGKSFSRLVFIIYWSKVTACTATGIIHRRSRGPFFFVIESPPEYMNEINGFYCAGARACSIFKVRLTPSRFVTHPFRSTSVVPPSARAGTFNVFPPNGPQTTKCVSCYDYSTPKVTQCYLLLFWWAVVVLSPLISYHIYGLGI
jgi:hypothetical protein